MHYVATIIPKNDGTGRHDVCFVDLPGCVTQGASLDDALRLASEILSLHVGTMIEDGDDLPEPSTPAQAREMDLQEASENNDPLPEGTLWQYVFFKPAGSVENAAVNHLNISLKTTVIEEIDSVARKMGLSRAGVIAAATREYASRIYASHAMP